LAADLPPWQRDLGERMLRGDEVIACWPRRAGKAQFFREVGEMADLLAALDAERS
jgi:hypothetical protein